jgi:hypothetical protein
VGEGRGTLVLSCVICVVLSWFVLCSFDVGVFVVLCVCAIDCCVPCCWHSSFAPEAAAGAAEPEAAAGAPELLEAPPEAPEVGAAARAATSAAEGDGVFGTDTLVVITTRLCCSWTR